MVTSGKLRFHKLRDQKTNNFNSFVWLNDGRKYCNRPLKDLNAVEWRPFLRCAAFHVGVDWEREMQDEF